MMQDNVHVILYKKFSYNGRIFKDVLKFYFKGEPRFPFYMLPKDDGTWFGLLGQGHIRGTVLENIRVIFNHHPPWEAFKNYGRIVEHFKTCPETEIKKTGYYCSR